MAIASEKERITAEEAKGLRTAKELEGHLAWLDTFTSAALGVLAIASGMLPGRDEGGVNECEPWHWW